MARIADFIYTRSGLIIILVVIINITALASFFRFDFDTDFMRTFNEGNPKAEEYNQLNEKYGSREPITILIESKSSLLSRENLLNIFYLQENIAEIDSISSVQNILPSEIIIGNQVVPINAAFIEANHLQLNDFIDNRYFLTDQYYSNDRLSATILVILATNASSTDVIDSLQILATDIASLEIFLAGNEVIEATLLDYLLRIIFVLPPIMAIMILIVFTLMLKNRKIAVLSMVPAGLAALWTFGTIFWSGERLGLTTILSPIFVIVIGSAYGLHFTSHLLNNLSEYAGDRHKLIIETLKKVGTPIFLATITTMAGFASLVWTDVVPMRQMGIFVSLGIGYAGFLAILFLPAILSRIKLPEKTIVSSENRLGQFIQMASKKRAIIAITFIAVTAISIFYIPSIEVVSNQLMFFKDGSDIRQTFNKVEEHFGGAIPLIGEISSTNPRATLLNPQAANKILNTERELEDVSGISSVFSVFDFIKGINKTTTGQDIYPQNPMLIQGLLAQLGNNQANWISADGFRMIIKTKDFANDDIDELNSFVGGNEDIQIVTGMPILFDEMNSLVVKSQVQSLGLALIIIFIMLWITLRKLKAALVGLIPIVITIVAILGMLSLTSFNLNIMTATLSAIAIGIGIDYSIHLISSIFYYRDRGASHNVSVTQALSTVSRPILANALGLIAGYSAFFFSPLKIHMHAGAVMWVAMLVSSMAALLLVPIFFSTKGKAKSKPSFKPVFLW
ncbi:RND family transporter [Chloroflexota bacterium]